MQKEIIWFTTYPENVDKLNAFFISHDLEVSAFYSPIEEIYDNIHRLIEAAGLKTAIVRGGLLSEIKENISIPVVPVSQTVIDFYNLFPEIENMSGKSALVGWYSSVKRLEAAGYERLHDTERLPGHPTIYLQAPDQCIIYEFHV